MSLTLDAVLQASEALLAEGAADPGSPWRNPSLVTTGAGGIPQARIVVLRRFDARRRIAEFHTDIRSAKFGELSARPAAGLHGWDASRQIQLRLAGRATLRVGADADAAWAALRPQSRATYQVQPGPGTVIGAPDDTTQGSEAGARAVFCVIELEYEALEHLHLGRESHQRARFTWQSGALAAGWVVP